MTETIIVAENANPHLVNLLSTGFRVIKVKDRDALNALPASDLASITGAVAAGGLLKADVEKLPNIKIVSVFGIGYDNVDLGLAKARGITVCNTPDVLNDEVADTAIALLLYAVRDFYRAEKWLREGQWPGNRYPASRFSLKGRHVGLIGLGKIGIEIARRLEPFKVTISYHTRSPRTDVSYRHYSSIVELAKAVDTLITIVPKTDATHKLVDGKVLRALGPDGILVNVGRGWSVDEDALVEALRDGTIGGAGLDVFYDEPDVPKALFDLPNVSLLPHIASFAEPARNAMAEVAAANFRSFFETGRVLNPVS